jgi:hypothetical protein
MGANVKNNFTLAEWSSGTVSTWVDKGPEIESSPGIGWQFF